MDTFFYIIGIGSFLLFCISFSSTIGLFFISLRKDRVSRKFPAALSLLTLIFMLCAIFNIAQSSCLKPIEADPYEIYCMQTDAVITESRPVLRHSGSDYDPPEWNITFSYEVDGITYENTERTGGNKNQVGQHIPIWYDPSDPADFKFYRPASITPEEMLSSAKKVRNISGLLFLFSLVLFGLLRHARRKQE
ncbi:MAG: DUF3592 domain-containing protein [Eubacteriales bacterium]|nr:DUF3592 domain-containing protein [Eubacteriales bacterium]